MKKRIIDRYEITDNNEAVIDVSVKSVEHLYHDFDKTAPYHRKELDEEFVDYLTECVREIGRHPFIIRISLENMPDEPLMERVRKSLGNHYVYLTQIEIRYLKRIFRRSAVLFIVGLVLLVFAIIATRGLVAHESVIFEVFAQGLTIAAWVSMWESLANIFLEWHPYKENIRDYNKIINAPVIFRPLSYV